MVLPSGSWAETPGPKYGGLSIIILAMNAFFSTSGKEPTCQCRRCKGCGSVPSGVERGRHQEMATHSSILAWKIPWTEEPGRLQS